MYRKIPRWFPEHRAGSRRDRYRTDARKSMWCGIAGRFGAGLPAEVRADPILLHGSPASQLIEAAEKGVDLLVMGSRRAGPLRRALLGSVSVRSSAGRPARF